MINKQKMESLEYHKQASNEDFRMESVFRQTNGSPSNYVL